MGHHWGRAPTGALTRAERRHLLRRLAFAATPALERSIEGLSAEAALDVLLDAASKAPLPAPPEVAHGVWTNRALRYAGMSAQHIEGIEEPGPIGAPGIVRRGLANGFRPETRAGPVGHRLIEGNAGNGDIHTRQVARVFAAHEGKRT